MNRTLAVIAIVIAIPTLAAADSGSIEFEMTGFESTAGSVLCALFDNKKDWLDNAVDGVVAPIVDGRAVCSFENLPAGDYAIIAHHDKDDNGKMKKTLGIPREPYVFSNNARVRFGPPSFARASFRHDGTMTRQHASLK